MSEKSETGMNNPYLKGHQIGITPLVLGTYVLKYNIPMKLVNEINEMYDNAKPIELTPWNDNLAGKIEEENNIDNLLTPQMNEIFMGCFSGYMKHCLPSRTQWITVLNTAWINEMKDNEYNPSHTHSSARSEIGLSSVLMLKRPTNYGKEYSNNKINTNGHLELNGGSQDVLSIAQIRVDAQVGDFYVFPYTVTHGVYPFNNTNQKRRTLSYNCDLLRPVKEAEKDNG